LLLVGISVAWAQQDAAHTPPAHKVFGDPNIIQYAPSRSYHVEHYKLALHFDPAKGEIFGDETVTLQPFADGFSSFDLDSSELAIESVVLTEPGHAATPLNFQAHDPKLSITLDHPYAAGTSLAVHLVYHGFPRTGVFFIHPDSQYPNRPEEIWTQGESEFNHYWFPCYDYPNDKATSEISVTVPDNQVVVSNGSLKSVTHDHGLATYHWVEAVPHSSYLNAIAVGPWAKYSQKYKNISVDYYVPNTVDEATALRSFSLTPDMIAFYASTFGVEYPYEKYAQTTVHNFTEGGMENISATTQTEWTLHDAKAEPDYKSQGLVAHELAHQWFGDLVTTRDWANIWLNEGFATFVEALYTQHHDGDNAYRHEIWQDQQSSQHEDRDRYRRSIVSRHYLYPEQVFDATTYPKGAAVLDMMRHVLGDKAFFESLHNYLLAHREKNVGTHDLMEAIRDTSGQNLDWFFAEWLFKGGFPEYEVHAGYDRVHKVETIRVLQTQKLDALTPIFDMPLDLAFIGPQGQRKMLTVRDHLAEQEFTLPLDFEPTIVDFDPNDYVDKTVKFDKSAQELIAQATGDPAVMSRLWAAHQLRDKDGSPDVIAALRQVGLHDSFAPVRAEAADSLGEIGTPVALNALLEILHDSDNDVRAAVVGALQHFTKNREVYAAPLERLHNDGSYKVQAAAAETLGHLEMPQAFAPLQEASQLEVTPANSVHYIVTAALGGLGAMKDPRAVPIILAHAQPGVPERVRIPALFELLELKDQLNGHESEVETTLRAAMDDSFPFTRDAGMRVAAGLRLKTFESRIAGFAASLPTAGERDGATQALREMRGQNEKPAAIPADVQKLQERVNVLEQKVKELEKKP